MFRNALLDNQEGLDDTRRASQVRLVIDIFHFLIILSQCLSRHHVLTNDPLQCCLCVSKKTPAKLLFHIPLLFWLHTYTLIWIHCLVGLDAFYWCYSLAVWQSGSQTHKLLGMGSKSCKWKSEQILQIFTQFPSLLLQPADHSSFQITSKRTARQCTFNLVHVCQSLA
jgi:hypothetical protein